MPRWGRTLNIELYVVDKSCDNVAGNETLIKSMIVRPHVMYQQTPDVRMSVEVDTQTFLICVQQKTNCQRRALSLSAPHNLAKQNWASEWSWNNKC